MNQKYLRCGHCGNIVDVIEDKGVPVMCCGEPMKEIIPGTTDAAFEKHIPAYEVKDGTVYVTVGEVEHPMIPEHYIQWVSVQTDKGNQLKYLKPGEPPKAVFALTEGETLEAVYAYCNLHSLWKK